MMADKDYENKANLLPEDNSRRLMSAFFISPVIGGLRQVLGIPSSRFNDLRLDFFLDAGAVVSICTNMLAAYPDILRRNTG